MRRQVIALACANVAALMAAILAYLFYSRLLGPGQFALLSGATALGRFGNLVLDGGIKTAIIKHTEDIGASVRRALFLGGVVVALALAGLLVLFMSVLHAESRISGSSAWFLSAYAGAYIFTYPFLFLHLADLERHRLFSPVATWESISITVEYLLPLSCWFALSRSFVPFVASAWLARIIRVYGLRAAHGGFSGPGAFKADWRGASSIFHEGWKFQAGTATAMVRDSLHYLLVGPLFGKIWVGYYSWVLQLASVSSQVFIQTASRVALPVLRTADADSSRWASAIVQMKWLAIFTIPPIAFLYHFAYVADGLFFSGKWAAAVFLVPSFSLRMLPGVATTGLGYLVLAQRGAGVFAIGNFWWTLCEVAAALACIWIFGAAGLAYSYAVMAWVGVVVFAQAARGGLVYEVLSTLFLRPCLVVSVLTSVALFAVHDRLGNVTILLASIVSIIVAILSEPDTRTLLRAWRLR